MFTLVPGLIVIAGGKWTTYRVMGKDAIDAVADALDGRIPPSVTNELALVGGEGYRAAWNQRSATAARTGLHRERPELAEPIPGADDYLQAEIVYATTHEGALHVDDVLARRTRISIEAWDRGVSAAPVTARLMAEILGWDAEHEQLEVDTYLERVRAERESQTMADDESADRVRLEAPEIVRSV